MLMGCFYFRVISFCWARRPVRGSIGCFSEIYWTKIENPFCIVEFEWSGSCLTMQNCAEMNSMWLNGKIECISIAFAAWRMFKNASNEEMRQWQLQSIFHQYFIPIHAVPSSFHYIIRITTTWALHFSVLIKPFTVIPISNHHRLASIISNFYASTNLSPIFVQHKINHKYPFADSQLHYIHPNRCCCCFMVIIENSSERASPFALTINNHNSLSSLNIEYSKACARINSEKVSFSASQESGQFTCASAVLSHIKHRLTYFHFINSPSSREANVRDSLHKISIFPIAIRSLAHSNIAASLTGLRLQSHHTTENDFICIDSEN